MAVNEADTSGGLFGAADDVVVGRAQAADVEGIIAVERQCFDYSWQADQYIRDLFESTASRGVVARVGGQVIGFGSVTCVYEHGHITTLGVVDAWRRRGIGRRLLAALLREAAAAGVREVVLEVRTTNEAAQRLYEGYGFRVTGVRRNYYLDPPDDALVMVWNREEAAAGASNPAARPTPLDRAAASEGRTHDGTHSPPDPAGADRAG